MNIQRCFSLCTLQFKNTLYALIGLPGVTKKEQQIMTNSINYVNYYKLNCNGQISCAQPSLKKLTGKFGALQGKQVCCFTPLFSLGCQEVLRS